MCLQYHLKIPCLLFWRNQELRMEWQTCAPDTGRRTGSRSSEESISSPSEARVTNSLKEDESWEGVRVKCVANSDGSKNCTFHTCTNRCSISNYEMAIHYFNCQLYYIVVCPFYCGFYAVHTDAMVEHLRLPYTGSFINLPCCKQWGKILQNHCK